MSKSSHPVLLTLSLVQPPDFLPARQRAKQIAAILGFETQDQTRIATAVSEIARNALLYAGGGKVEYSLDNTGDRQRFCIVISDHGPGIPDLVTIRSGNYVSTTGMGLGIEGSRRLLDDLKIDTGPHGTVMTLIKTVPPGKPVPSVAKIAQQLGKTSINTDAALIDQNQELVRLVAELNERQVELERLNREMDETNRGVMVLYAELEDKALSVQQAAEAKSRFLSGVTHELRTPLNSIVSLSRLLLHHTDGDLTREQEKQVQFIQRSAQNLTEMVNDLLDLARVEAGKATLKITEFDVADTLAALRGMFRPIVLNEHVTLTFIAMDQPISLRTDEGKLAQILRNFISNSLKFTEQGTVEVSATRCDQPAGVFPGAPAAVSAGPQIVFKVADTGIGIAPEHAELVMQEWGQVETPQHGRHKGSGLGLPLSRRFAELLGGHIWFQSRSGVGSTFYLSLPLPVSDHTPGRSSQEEQAKSEPERFVLVADDDDVSRYLLKRHLAALTSARIVEVASGQACLDAIHQEMPAVLFLDLLMPGLPGIEVVRRLRENTATRELPIVIVTEHVPAEADLQHLREMNVSLLSKHRLSEGETESGTELDAMQPLETGSAEAAGSFVLLERALLEVGLSNIHQR